MPETGTQDASTLGAIGSADSAGTEDARAADVEHGTIVQGDGATGEASQDEANGQTEVPNGRESLGEDHEASEADRSTQNIQLNHFTWYGSRPERAFRASFRSVDREKLDSLWHRMTFSFASVDSLVSLLEARRIAILVAPYEHGGTTHALLAAARLCQRQPLDGALLAEDRPRSGRISLLDLAMDDAAQRRVVVREETLDATAESVNGLQLQSGGASVDAVADQLRKQDAMMILVTRALSDDARALAGTGIVHELPLPSPQLLHRCLRTAAEVVAAARAEHASEIQHLLEQHGPSLPAKLRTFPRVVRFVQRYLLDVATGKLSLDEALADFESLRHWFLDTLANDDPDAWVAALALTLCLPRSESMGTPWLHFDLLRRDLARILRRELCTPRSERSLGSFCRADERILAKIGATGPPARFLQFRDSTTSGRLWEVFLGAGRGVVAVVLPALQDLAESQDPGLRYTAARALGRVGQIDPDLIAMPLIERWSKAANSPDFRLGFLLEGALAALEPDYRGQCLDAYVDWLEDGSAPAIYGLAAVAQADLGLALEQLRKVLPVLAQDLNWPAAAAMSKEFAILESRLCTRRLFTALQRHRREALWPLTRRLVPKGQLTMLAATRTVIRLVAADCSEPALLLATLAAWSRNDPEKLAPLIAILVLHPAGAMDGWLHRGPAPTAEEDCTPALVKLAHSESLCPTMRNLLVEVYRGLTPVPGRFRSLLEERLTALLADWSLQAMASGRLRRAMTRLLAELYECSESGLVELVLQAARERNPEPELRPLHDLALDALTGQTLPE